jgi:hypothetical protein
MKKIETRFFCMAVVLILLFAVLSACAGNPAPAPVQAAAPKAVATPDELEAAVRETSDYLNKQLPKGNKLMILNVQSDFPALSEYIIDELIANTVNDRIFSVVDRQQLNAIRAELDFQMSGEVDDATAQSLGRMAGAQLIISGAVSRIGDLYRLRVRALSVQSAQIEAQFNKNISSGPTVSALVNSKATGYGNSTIASTGSATGQAGTASAAVVVPSTSTANAVKDPPPAPQNLKTGTVESTSVSLTWTSAGSWLSYRVYYGTAADSTQATLAGNAGNTTYTVVNLQQGTPYYFWVTAMEGTLESAKSEAVSATTIKTYKIGDTGPGGGFIFYDKGNNSGGWRYLEAAPVGTEFTAQWGTYEKGVAGTKSEVGSGRENTRLIVGRLRFLEETGKAAQLCVGLNVNGHSDWFLPSKDELNLMYINLGQMGLGGFGDKIYWSSSEYNKQFACSQRVSDGSQYQYTVNYKDYGKIGTLSVRAVRAF